MFFWNSLAFSMIQWMLAIWCLVPLPFLNPAWKSGSSQFMYCLKPHLENFVHYVAGVWDECSCTVVWTFFGYHCYHYFCTLTWPSVYTWFSWELRLSARPKRYIWLRFGQTFGPTFFYMQAEWTELLISHFRSSLRKKQKHKILLMLVCLPTKIML